MDAVCGKKKPSGRSISMVWELETLYILSVRGNMMPDDYDLMEQQAPAPFSYCGPGIKSSR
jgi:hypothetical protein